MGGWGSGSNACYLNIVDGCKILSRVPMKVIYQRTSVCVAAIT